ncbi:MAG: DegT/DnrJ/EryC1/StrS family aminotransferase [Chloroherpetonaceae bacterium]|nr:DegT/DnrJ/EryC1/StrS family aminotransferase [Chthonomonadaceae bacterium]MDW8207639.1 DegT/DnrJ/EryC1/StrS family aminotransferase [Chloroherpetonaceae bacterium]
MRVPLADLRAQYYELKEEIDAAIVSVIESCRFSGGDRVIRLEEEIAHFCGAEYGVGVASGTDALTLSLIACGVGNGDEVITTPFTFGATTEAIVHAGARPVYVDIDNCTFNIDVERIEQAITPRTRALLPVDLYGQMADRAALVDIARRYNLKLVIDSAQSIGARQNGRPIAMDGDTTTLSFYPTKNLGAYGDGGMILTNDPQIATLLRSLRAHGTGSHKYAYERVGFCSRLDAIQAAVLLAKLPRLPEWNEGRRRNAMLYQELLGDLIDCGFFLPRVEVGNYHIYHQFTVRTPRRDALMDYLRENGVDSEIYYPCPLHLQPAYAYLGYRAGDLPGAEQAAREVLSLPIHPELTEEQITYVAGLIRRFFKQK